MNLDGACATLLPLDFKEISDVNKDLTCKAKAKAKDLSFEAKAKAKDLTFKAKPRTYVARQQYWSLRFLYRFISIM